MCLLGWFNRILANRLRLLDWSASWMRGPRKGFAPSTFREAISFDISDTICCMPVFSEVKDLHDGILYPHIFYGCWTIICELGSNDQLWPSRFLLIFKVTVCFVILLLLSGFIFLWHMIGSDPNVCMWPMLIDFLARGRLGMGNISVVQALV
jgi:hypothetical protein